MNRVLARVSLMLLALWLPTSVLAADDDADEAVLDQLDQARERGVLEVAVYRDFPPYSYPQQGKYVGADVDLAAALARKIGLPLYLWSASQFAAAFVGWVIGRALDMPYADVERRYFTSSASPNRSVTNWAEASPSAPPASHSVAVSGVTSPEPARYRVSPNKPESGYEIFTRTSRSAMFNC